MTATAAEFTTGTLRAAADRDHSSHRPVWVGPSGEQSTGESVARHLEAAAALLDRDGWVRTYQQGGDQTTDDRLTVTDSMTVRDMLRALIRLVRDTSGSSERTLYVALHDVAEYGVHGDTDTCAVASQVLHLIVRAHTGSDTADALSWSERQHRTHTDVTALLTAGAQYARTYGPDTAQTTQAA